MTPPSLDDVVLASPDPAALLARMRDNAVVILFLDFDGVLRRLQAPEGELETCCLEAFEDALRSLPDAEIVITSNWREFNPVDGFDGFPSRSAPGSSARLRSTTPGKIAPGTARSSPTCAPAASRIVPGSRSTTTRSTTRAAVPCS